MRVTSYLYTNDARFQKQSPLDEYNEWLKKQLVDGCKLEHVVHIGKGVPMAKGLERGSPDEMSVILLHYFSK